MAVTGNSSALIFNGSDAVSPTAGAAAVAFLFGEGSLGALSLTEFTVNGSTSGTATLANGKVKRAYTGDTAFKHDTTGDNISQVFYILAADLPTGALTAQATLTGTPEGSIRYGVMMSVMASSGSVLVDATDTLNVGPVTTGTPTPGYGAATLDWEGFIAVSADTLQIAAFSESPNQSTNVQTGIGWTERRDLAKGQTQYAAHSRDQNTNGAPIVAQTQKWGLLCQTQTGVGCGVLISFKEGLAAPGYNSTPVVSATTTQGYTISASPTQASTMYVAAYHKGEMGVTVAKVIAGTDALAFANSGAVSALATATATLSGLSYPTHDIYVVFQNSVGASGLTLLANRYINPPTGLQFVEANITGAVGSGSIAFGAVDPPVTGDVWIVPTSVNGYPITCDPDGTLHVEAGGDTSRLIFQVYAYDTSGFDWSNPPPGVNQIVNNKRAEVFDSGAPIGTQTVRVGSSQSFSPATIFTDPEGQALTYTMLETLTSEETFVSNVYTFSPLAKRDQFTRTFVATDDVGDTNTFALTFEALSIVDAPNAIGLQLIDGQLLMQAAGFSTITGTPQNTTQFAPGTIVDQIPAPGEAVDPMTPVILTYAVNPFSNDKTAAPKNFKRDSRRARLAREKVVREKQEAEAELSRVIREASKIAADDTPNEDKPLVGPETIAAAEPTQAQIMAPPAIKAARKPLPAKFRGRR